MSAHFMESVVRAFHQQAFFNSYWKSFAVVKADTNALKAQVFALRYEVYCRENRFMEPAEHPDGDERDRWDDEAVHFLLLHKKSGEAVGCLRLLPPDLRNPLESFELQGICDHPLLQIESRIRGLCEISRFCMAPPFRRRPRDGHLLPAYYEQEGEGEDRPGLSLFRRRIPYAPLGLLAAAFETALHEGVAVVES